jgi:hypothetical protein
MTENIKIRLGDTGNVLLKVAGIVGAITVIAGGYTFYLNHLWKPKIEVLEVDFEKGKAKVKMGGNWGKILDIDGDTLFLLAGDWGIKFGTILQDGKTVYDRLELVRKGMVYEYLKR